MWNYHKKHHNYRVKLKEQNSEPSVFFSRLLALRILIRVLDGGTKRAECRNKANQELL